MIEKDIPPYVPNKKEQEDITRAMRFRDESYEQTRQERAEWRASYLRYKLSRQLSEYEYIEDVQLGLTYDSVERISASLPGREFGFKARPVGPEDTKSALLFSEALTQAWNSPEVMDGPNKMEVIKKNMALFGSSFAQVYWETQVDEMGNVIKSDPAFYPLNIFDVYYNKFIPEIEELPEIGYQSIVSLNWLKENGKQLGYKNLKYVRGFTPKSSNTQDKDSGTIDGEETLSGKQRKPVLAKIFEIQSDKEILTLAIDDGGAVFLRKIPNKLGKKNIVIFRLKKHPLPNRLLGVTDVARGGSIEDAIQRAMNQTVFNSLLVSNPVFTFDATDRHIDPRTFITAPGAGIPRGRDTSSLTPISFPSHMNESLQLIATLQERYKRVVNTPDISAGQATGNTATSDSINDQNAKGSIDKIVDGMKNSMQKLGVIIRDLYAVYGPESITVQVRTPELAEKLSEQQSSDDVAMEIPKEDFVLARDIDITVDFTSQNKAVLSRRLVEWLSITAKDQTVSPQLRMMAYEKWLSFNDLDDLAAMFMEGAKMGQTSDIAQAEMENQKMGSGVALPPTPGATQAHTQRHVDFMRRAETGPEIDRLLQAHIEGEIQALQAQGGQQPWMGQGMAPQEDMGMIQTGTESPIQEPTL